MIEHSSEPKYKPENIKTSPAAPQTTRQHSREVVLLDKEDYPRQDNDPSFRRYLE